MIEKGKRSQVRLGHGSEDDLLRDSELLPPNHQGSLWDLPWLD